MPPMSIPKYQVRKNDHVHCNSVNRRILIEEIDSMCSTKSLLRFYYEYMRHVDVGILKVSLWGEPPSLCNHQQ